MAEHIVRHRSHCRWLIIILLDILNFWRAVNLPGLQDLEGFATLQQKNVQYYS